MHAVQCKTSLKNTLIRSWRGTLSAGAGLALPLGGWWLGKTDHHDDEDRLSRGLAIVLPGIEGRGALSYSICRGIRDGGFPGEVVLWDWTTGLWPLLLYHLRGWRRNRIKAATLAQLILDHQNDYPGRPVYLVGHSGGAAIAAWTLEVLPVGRSVTGAVMLGAALSPSFSLAPALRKVNGYLWNFYSPYEIPLLAAGTFLFGTADGRHSVSAGLCGFAVPVGTSCVEEELYQSRLRQRRYEFSMARQFHLGGHFGWANRVFVAEVVAPLLSNDSTTTPFPE
jgi:hypothetical protein